MKMQKRKFRIGNLAQKLDLDRFVIRFWEKEFNLKPHRSEGGQRFYDEQDFAKFKIIKNLLYEKKFTIAGAKKELQRIPNNSKIIASQKTTIGEPKKSAEAADSNENLIKQIVKLKKQLLKLRNLI